jgi:hypothetical protein
VTVARSSLVALSLLALGVAACGSSTDNSASSTSAPTTTTTAAVTSTTTTASAVPTSPITIPTKNDGVSADGSGCAPPHGDTLPDGIWFGDLKAVDVAGATVSLDLNCFFTGDAANRAAMQDGQTDIPVPNDYYIRNKVKKIYVVPTVADVAVFKLSQMGGGPLVKAGNGLPAAASMLAEFNNHWIGWLQVSGGKVIAIQQQFVP